MSEHAKGHHLTRRDALAIGGLIVANGSPARAAVPVESPGLAAMWHKTAARVAAGIAATAPQRPPCC